MAAEEETLAVCYGAASIAGAIVATLLITVALAAAALLIYNMYWRSRKGQHLVLVSDVENQADQYAFDNPNFREATPIKQSPYEEKSGKLDLSWLGNVFSTPPRPQKRTSLDDSNLHDSEVKVVSLKSHDFTGLGFSICGNMRDGIFVKDLLHRGPAFESGSINPGDRIDSVCISFRHMVYEDALTILSYASPYEVKVEVEHNATSRPSTLLRKRDHNDPPTSQPILHPFYRSHSISHLPVKRENSGSRTAKTPEPQENATVKPLAISADVRKETQTVERRAIDTVDSTDPPKHTKFGIKVLPVNIATHQRSKDVIENDENTAIQHSNGAQEDVKTILTKGFQNLKEKINQNTLGRKKKDGDSRGATPPIPEEPAPTSPEIPEEVERAGDMARQNRKSASAESLAARRSAAEIAAANCDSDGSSEEKPQRLKKSKGKAPNPPQFESPASDNRSPTPDRTEDTHHDDSDSDCEQSGVTSTEVTVHHSPAASDEPEAGRKAASLGDLSRLDETQSSGTLERAVSLDLDASSKKRKAPPPPAVDDFSGSYENVSYRKEPRLEGYDTFQRRLKKSSDFGTLEDALQDSDQEMEAPIHESPEPEDPHESQESFVDITSVAANNIQEFSSWLEEVRKPKSPEPDIGHQVTVSLNAVQAVTNFNVSTGENTTNFSTPPETPEKSAPPPNTDHNSLSLEIPDSTINVTPPQPSYSFSVNGHNLQEAAPNTVLLISQPNSLEPDLNLVDTELDVPPQLPKSPPPVSAPSYITEIRVTETPKQKPVRKDSPEMSKIPVRTMKSETGQRVLQAIQSLAAKELMNKEGPSVAGFQLKKTPPVVPPRRSELNESSQTTWTEGSVKERVNGTPRHIQIPNRVSFPVKTSATKIVFESPHQNNEEF